MIDTTTRQTNKQSINGIWYLLAGGGIGAGLALLFAPKSGVELRTDISDLTKKGYDETVGIAYQLKEQSADAFYTLKEKTAKVYDLAANKWTHLNESVMELPGEIVSNAANLAEDKTSHKKAPGRKSAAIL